MDFMYTSTLRKRLDKIFEDVFHNTDMSFV